MKELADELNKLTSRDDADYIESTIKALFANGQILLQASTSGMSREAMLCILNYTSDIRSLLGVTQQQISSVNMVLDSAIATMARRTQGTNETYMLAQIIQRGKITS